MISTLTYLEENIENVDKSKKLKEESNGYYEWKKCDTKIMNSVGKFNFM